jgi:hypothetical protein
MINRNIVSKTHDRNIVLEYYGGLSEICHQYCLIMYQRQHFKSIVSRQR